MTAARQVLDGIEGRTEIGPGRETSEAWRSVGPYDLEAEIGRGGMGVVYRARQRGLNRTVAVKWVRREHFADPLAVARFRAEAELAARLCHPNIVGIHEIGEIDGRPYFSMDYVEGRGLDELVREHPLTARRAAGYVRTVAAAVQFAHDRGVLHRDLKPSNILIDVHDEPRILDFGLARPLSGGAADPAVGQPSLGSPGFVAPEQAAGWPEQVEAATDVYSLGAVLYYLLTQRPPFVADSLATALRLVRETEPVGVRLLNPGIPVDLATICQKCLERQAHRRYATASALAEDLGRFLRDEPILARPVGPWGRTARWCRRKPVVAGLAGALGLMTLSVLVGALMAAHRIDRSRRLAEREAYVAGLGLARAHIESGSIDLAMQTLTNCPAAHRHWEWGYLVGLCHDEMAGFRAHPSTNLPVIAFSPDGRLLATLVPDGPMQLWDPAGAVEILRLGAEGPPVSCARIGPRSERLAAGFEDGRVEVWRGETAPVPTHATVPRAWTRQTGFAAHRDGVNSVDWSGDARQLVTAGNDGWVRIWDLVSERLLREWRSGWPSVREAWLSPDQDRVVARGESAMGIWERTSGTLVGMMRSGTDPPGPVWADPAGHCAVMLDAEGGLSWNRLGGESRALIRLRGLGNGRLPEVGYSPDGRWMCNTGDGATARVWRVADGAEHFALPVRVHQGVFSRDGRLLATLGSHDYAVLWEVEPGRELMRLQGHEAILTAVAFSPEGDRVATMDQRGEVRLWSTRRGATLLESANSVWGVGYSPDGRWVVMAGRFEGCTVWDSRTGRREARWVGPPEWTPATAFDPGSRRLVTAGSHRRVRVWEVGTWRLLASLAGHERCVLGARFSADGGVLFSYSRDGVLRFWDGATYAPRRVLDSGMNPLFGATLSHDGTWVAAGDERGTVQIWDVASGQRVQELRGHSNQIYGIAFSPDDARLVTSSTDGRVSIWQRANGRRLVSWLARGCEWPIEFGPDGRRLFAGTTRHDFADWDNPRLVLRDAQDGRQLLSVGGVGMLTGLSFRAADRRVLAGAFEGWARQLEAFPWREDEYPGGQQLDLATRIHLFGRRHAVTREGRLAAVARGELGALAEKVVEVGWEPDFFPARDPRATPSQIDLGRFYTSPLELPSFPTFGPFNGDQDFRDLPRGLVTWHGVALDVRGVIQLRRHDERGGRFRRGWEQWPRELRGIPVQRKARVIHVLHGSVFGAEEGQVVGSYECIYSDGGRHSLDIVYGEDVGSDGTSAAETNRESGRGKPVWRRRAAEGERPGVPLAIFLSSYVNPRPDVEIATVDFVSHLTASGPFLIAMTLEGD